MHITDNFGQVRAAMISTPDTRCDRPGQVLTRACLFQWRGERYDGTSTRTGPLQSKKLKIELKDNAKNE